MPPRNTGLPEGTDHIIDTNIDLGDTGGGSGGGSGGSGAAGSGASGSGTSGSSTSAGTSGGASSAGGGSAFQFEKDDADGEGRGAPGKAADTIAGQVREQISTLKSQAGDRARSLADDGKRQTTDFLQKVAEVVGDAAGSVESRLGGQYAGIGHRASDSINALASSLDDRSVDDLFEDARAFVKRSPAVAVGIAAVVGFAIARVVRSSVSEMSGSSGDGSGGTARPTDGNGKAGGKGASDGAAMGSAGASGAATA